MRLKLSFPGNILPLKTVHSVESFSKTTKLLIMLRLEHCRLFVDKVILRQQHILSVLMVVVIGMGEICDPRGDAWN